MPGPPPKPTAQLKLAGSWRASKRKKEPKLADAAPQPPAWLSDEAKESWNELVAVLLPMRVLTPSDALSLAQLAEYLARWKRVTAAVNRFGEVFRMNGDDGKFSHFKRSPYVTQQIEYGLMLRRMMAEFGLTPAARSRLTTNEETKEVESIFSRKAFTG
jgi:P27 family predicted phage terminase small subunit